MTRSILMMKRLTAVEHHNDFVYSIARAPGIADTDFEALREAVDAFMDDIDGAIWDAWMGGLFWVDLDEGNIAIDSRAESAGRLFPPEGEWERTITDRGGITRQVHLRHLYEAMGIDWTKIRASKRDVYDGHLLVIDMATGIPTLQPVPAAFLPLIDTTH